MPGFPCVGAKSALSKGQMRILVARDITSAWDDMRIYPACSPSRRATAGSPTCSRALPSCSRGRATSMRRASSGTSGTGCSRSADKDAWLGHPLDERVAKEPDNPHFSLSFAGEAFFVVGLHPNASRPARRFSSPALVFNLHAQFEQLREAGRYEKLRSSILERDEALAGSITRCWRGMVRSRKHASTADVSSTRTGAARSSRARRTETSPVVR